MTRILPAALLPVVLIAACTQSPQSSRNAAEALALNPPAKVGSLGANLARGTAGDIVLSWLEPAGDGHALRYARWRDRRWEAPATVASGDHWFVNWADFPSVVPIDDEVWAAHWLSRRPAGGYAYDVYASISRDGGTSWSDARRPHRDDTDTEHGFVTIYPAAGGAGLVWLDGRRMGGSHDDNDTMQGMSLRAAVLSPAAALSGETELDALTCDCCQTDVAITDRGPVAVYRDRSEDETRDIYAARLVDGRWLPGRPVANDGWVIPGCPVNGPVIASRGNEVAVAWFTHADDLSRVRLARSKDAAASFAMPVDVAGGATVGRVGLAVLDDGTAVVSWLKSGGNGTAQLMLTPVSASGDVGDDYPVASDVASFSVPQIVQDDDGLLLVWTTTTDGKPSLAGTRVSLDRII